MVNIGSGYHQSAGSDTVWINCWYCHGSQADTSTVWMVFGLALTMAPFVLVVVVARFMGPVFVYFFQKFPNFCMDIQFRAGVNNLSWVAGQTETLQNMAGCTNFPLTIAFPLLFIMLLNLGNLRNFIQINSWFSQFITKPKHTAYL